jgi:hypothetical protein
VSEDACCPFTERGKTATVDPAGTDAERKATAPCCGVGVGVGAGVGVAGGVAATGAVGEAPPPHPMPPAMRNTTTIRFIADLQE